MTARSLEELAQIVRDGLDRPASDETLAALAEILRRAALQETLYVQALAGEKVV